jgi:hypothetical protein
MSKKLIGIALAVVLVGAGFLALNQSSSVGDSTKSTPSSSQLPEPATQANKDIDAQAVLAEYKAGFADGFYAGAADYNYPDAAAFSERTADYGAGFSEGYSAGQNQQAEIRSRLCNAEVSSNMSPLPSSRTAPAPAPAASTGALGNRVYNSERVDQGLGSTARKALIIGSGAAIGAGVGAAVGGKKGAAIGALAGGGGGTALALTKKPSRAFNRRTTTKSTLTKALIGAGAGAGIGALAGGKRGAAAGAAIGGGSGVVWSLIGGKRTRQNQ